MEAPDERTAGGPRASGVDSRPHITWPTAVFAVNVVDAIVTMIGLEVGTSPYATAPPELTVKAPPFWQQHTSAPTVSVTAQDSRGF